MAIPSDKLKEMLKRIVRGDDRPEGLNREEAETWAKLEEEVKAIQARGGSVDISFEIPEL